MIKSKDLALFLNGFLWGITIFNFTTLPIYKAIMGCIITCYYSIFSVYLIKFYGGKNK